MGRKLNPMWKRVIILSPGFLFFPLDFLLPVKIFQVIVDAYGLRSPTYWHCFG